MTKIIDFETHVQPVAYFKEVLAYQGYPRLGYDAKGRLCWYAGPNAVQGWRASEKLQDIKQRLEEMDRTGTDMEVISSSSPNCEAFPTQLGIKLARTMNDYIGECVAEHPDRFIGLASLPLQDTEAALTELDRAHGLGLKGIIVFSNIEGKPVDREEHWPVYERAEKLGLPIFLHPAQPTNLEMLSEFSLWGPAFGFGVDTALAALRLIMSGVFERYPNTRVVLGHLGETIPFFFGRIDWSFLRAPEAVPRIKRKPSNYFRSNFYVDTSGVFNEPSLMCTWETLGHDRVIYGSDYPFEDMTKSKEFVTKSRISESDQEKIFWENTATLFHL